LKITGSTKSKTAEEYKYVVVSRYVDQSYSVKEKYEALKAKRFGNRKSSKTRCILKRKYLYTIILQ
jgi:hypothetical protein